ncbi:unnamed protein product [Brassicogethes aeneus]|uniref:dolichol kinase n=1 Tax=Brassicogethes aeneus TaxID=1431903 RepID=A0A9P0B8I4_BRAAE|nr:unnamed protein product [Brassicogethes aeneus]
MVKDSSILILTRPRANDGIWLTLLLPISIITSTLTHPIVLTPTYKLVAVFCVGLISTSLVFYYQYLKKEPLQLLSLWHVPSIILSGLIFNLYLNKDLIFSIISALFCTLFYYYKLKWTLLKFPHSFTIGEACLIAQALVLILFSTALNLLSLSNKVFISNMQVSTLIIQVGLSGIGVIAYSTNVFKIKNVIFFYLIFVTVVIMGVLLPVHIILKRSPILWILELMLYDISSIKLISFWVICSLVAVIAVRNQIYFKEKATTSQRKVFHILAVSVFVPGLIYKCSFLYLASGVVLGIFFCLEILRIKNIPPIGKYLQDGFSVFSDEKDCGIVAFTPIYLLTGCALPLWIHPAPCDPTDSASFSLLPLLSGVLTIGIGDTAASVIGSNYGKHKWKGSSKTIEGTMACIFSQFAFVMLLNYLDWIRNMTTFLYIKTAVAILLTSIVEAKTTQVDNLVLPLIMYIILI